jgi:hypothetical protein
MILPITAILNECRENTILVEDNLFATLNVKPLKGQGCNYTVLPQNWKIAINTSTALKAANHWPDDILLLDGDIINWPYWPMDDDKNYFIVKEKDEAYSPSICDALILIIHKPCPLGTLTEDCQINHHCVVNLEADYIYKKAWSAP